MEEIIEEQARKIILSLGRNNNVFIDVINYLGEWCLVGSKDKNDFSSIYCFAKSQTIKFICNRDINKYVGVTTADPNKRYRLILNELLKLSQESDIIYPHFAFGVMALTFI